MQPFVFVSNILYELFISRFKNDFPSFAVFTSARPFSLVGILGRLFGSDFVRCFDEIPERLGKRFLNGLRPCPGAVLPNVVELVPNSSR